MLRSDREHVRVVSEVVVVDAEEAEHESGRPVIAVDVADRDEAAVVQGGKKQLRRHGDVPTPDLLLDRDGQRAGSDVGRDFDPERHGVAQYRANCPSRYAAAAWRTTSN